MIKTEGLDTDNFITKEAGKCIKFLNIVRGPFATPLSLRDYSSDWSEMAGVTREAAERLAPAYLTPSIFRSIDVVEGAGLYIAQASKIRRLKVVTARPDNLKGVTEDLYESLAPGAIEKVICTQKVIGGRVVALTTKDQVCLEEDIDGLTDDQVSTCRRVEAAGLRAFLWGDWHWNQDAEGLTRVTDFPDWISRLEAEDVAQLAS